MYDDLCPPLMDRADVQPVRAMGVAIAFGGIESAATSRSYAVSVVLRQLPTSPVVMNKRRDSLFHTTEILPPTWQKYHRVILLKSSSAIWVWGVSVVVESNNFTDRIARRRHQSHDAQEENTGALGFLRLVDFVMRRRRCPSSRVFTSSGNLRLQARFGLPPDGEFLL